MGLTIWDRSPFTDETVIWHAAFHSQEDSLVLPIFLKSQPVRDGLTAVAALQRSRVVLNSHSRDVCRKGRGTVTDRAHLPRARAAGNI